MPPQKIDPLTTRFSAKLSQHAKRSARTGRPAKYSTAKKTRSVRLTDLQLHEIIVHFGSLQKMVEQTANSYIPGTYEFFNHS